MNKIFLLGRLIKEPIFKETKNQKHFAELNIEVDESYISDNKVIDKKNIHTVLAWDQLSPIVAKLNINDLILIEGSLVTSKVVNSTTGGQFTNQSINAQKIKILITAVPKVDSKSNYKEQYFNFPTDDDIPF